MKCFSCGQPSYSQYHRMESLKFSEDSPTISYSPIKAPQDQILIQKKNFHLGEYFLKREIHSRPLRVKQYNQSDGYFKKYMDSCIPRAEEKRKQIPPSRMETVLLFKQKKPRKFSQAVTLKQPPRKYRWSVWYINLTINNLLSNDSYQRLIRSYKEDVITIVKKDVPRTFSTNPFFKDRILKIEVGREMLYKTCKAVGTYFPEVGYCQGLNFLVGFMLQVSGGKELEVVNAIISLCTDSRFLALGVYDRMFPVVQFLKRMFWTTLKKLDKRLANHIKNTGLPDDVWLTKWFISFFTGYFSPYYAARFLDFIFGHDIFTMPVLAAVVTHSLKSKIYAKPMDVVNEVIQGLKDIDNHTGKKKGLPEPEILLKKSERVLFKNADILKEMDNFMNDQEYYGQEEFKKYLHPFRDYLITGKGKHINFKIFDFAAESIRAPESRMSHSEISVSHSLHNLATPRRLKLPEDSDVQVPEENSIPHPVPSQFLMVNTKIGLNDFKKKNQPQKVILPPIKREMSFDELPQGVESTPLRISGTHVETKMTPMPKNEAHFEEVVKPNMINVQRRTNIL